MSACVVEGQVPSWREADRLAALRDFGILDSESEPAFDEIARLAARICHAPIALVSLVDEQRQWFKCEIGLSGVRETAREAAICSHAILQSNLFIVPDTTKDPRFRDNPLVTGEPHLRFYAGAPLITDQGLPLGTLCVLDSKPRAQGLTPEQADAVLTLSRAVMSQLKLRKANKDLYKQKAELVALLDGLPQVLWSFGPGGRDNHNNKRWYEFTGAVPGSAQEKGWVRLIHPEDQERVSAVWQHAVETGSPYEIEHRLRHHSGEYRWVLARTVPLHDDQGRIKRWLGTGTDIHEAKQTQQALAEREEFTRRLLSSSDDCIKVLDLDGKLRSMSEGGLRVMEVDDFSRIEGCHWPDFWTGSAAEQAQAAIETAQAGGTGRFQGFCPTMAGAPKWWDVLVTAIKGPEGKPERLLSISRDITDQKKTEQALRESEHRYRALVEASATIVWRATPDGSIVDGSTEWESITGQSPEAFKGFGWLSAVHPDDGERVISHWQDILASRWPGTNEFRVQHLSGAYKWFATKAVPLLNADGTVQEWVGTITDIHEQKTASERLRVSEERYRALIDASAAVVWRARPDGAVVQGWGWETFCGQRPEGFQGYGWLDNVHPDDRESVISAWQAALAARQPSVAEYRIRRFDGEYRWSLTRAVPLLGSDGTVQEWVGAITDIHEQKTASEIIRQREEQHRALLEASSVVLWLATPDGMITETRGWREVTGQEDSESAGLGSADTLHPDDKDWTVRAWQTAVLRGMPYENECRVRQKDGTYRWMLTRAVPLRNPDGSIREWVGGLSDIHGRKQAEESLRTSEERLRLALQAGRMAALELDLRTNIISRHHNTIDLLGIESSSLSDFMEQVHPDDQHKRDQFFSDIEAHGASSLEFRYTLPDGQTRWFKLRAERIDPHQVVGLIFDITEAKRAEAALAEKAGLLRATLENMDQGLIMADAADRVTVFNRRALDLLDLPLDLMTGSPLVQEVKTYQERMGDVAPDDNEVLKLAQTGNFLSDPLTYERTRPNGTVLEIRTVPLPEGGAVRTYTDITARRRAEGELRASEERLRLALQAGRMIAWEQDLTTNYVTRSPNSLDLLGIGSGPLSEFLERVHPGDKPAREQFLAKIEGEGVETIEFRYHPLGGEIMWLASRGERAGLSRVVGVSYDITERKKTEQELWRLANHDPLTGLPNRSLFQHRLEEALADAQRTGGSVSLLLIDLDNFKEVNDSFGHDAGDALLKEVAQRLSSGARECDTVARLSGDEFAVLLTSSRLQHAATLAEGIGKRVGLPFSYAGQMLITKASIGVACFPDHDAIPTELMKDADLALYRAKGAGRNRVVTYTPEMRAETERRIVLRREMRKAVSLDEIAPFYQPKISLATGEIVGFEALARWQHPSRGLLTPATFGAAFDDPELATMVGKRLIGKVASDMRRWFKQGFSPGRVAINLSHAEFIQPGLAEDILRILDLANVPAKHFEIEITEKVLLDTEADAVLAALEKFRSRGVQIALDDFGTGYASLTHLKQFPVDHLKIDQTFVRNIEQDQDDNAIVAAVVSLGRSLNLQVTAEGVETIGQAQRLREMGCGNGQGYLYAKPMAGAEIPELLTNWAARLIPAQRLILVER